MAFDRSPPSDVTVVDRFDGGVGWRVHPEERAARTSHAFVADEEVWVVDPLDAPGVDDLLTEYGEVAGVAVLSTLHTRDAAAFARRHDVPVSLPPNSERVAERLDAPTRRLRNGDGGFTYRQTTPLPSWRETVAYRASDGTLYAADSLGTVAGWVTGEERLGVYLFCRPVPPRRLFAGYAPDRVLVGHGDGVFDEASVALDDALAGARRRFPRALAEDGGAQLRALADALSASA
ncbi:hypothetical protein [Halomarina oriensis]|uniref:MBL fold metallo-hydrolase n=1 Tax=Halomarina oriensis TaxID=671145 RepID=A0A6B0GNE6_9EURY|nr:hypothetical protein [Halomarina oriensis]MWG35107.1 hypothetical protein [Halomarina oriensis]